MIKIREQSAKIGDLLIKVIDCFHLLNCFFFLINCSVYNVVSLRVITLSAEYVSRRMGFIMAEFSGRCVMSPVRDNQAVVIVNYRTRFLLIS